MKEAMGGTLLFNLVITFVVIYMAIMALGINYAITFRVKNQIINIIEKNNSYDDAKDEIAEYLSKVNYYGGSNSTSINCMNNTNGYCIEQINLTSGGYYYVVTTYVRFDFPIFENLRLLSFMVKGETSIMGRVREL